MPTTPRKRRFSKSFRVVLLSICLFVVLAEVASRGLLWLSGLGELSAVMSIEAPVAAPIFTFDPASGYRLSTAPIRYFCVNPAGRVQSIGSAQGNNLGFPDPTDFHPRRQDGSRLRIAVFGDSMTAGLFLPVNWPRRVEELFRQRDRDVELLNFSIDGGGFMNWWSIIRRELVPKAYELDGCLFAVCCNDLFRGVITKHDFFQNGRHDSWMGKVPGQRAENVPANLDEARRHLVIRDSNGWSKDYVDRLTRGELLLDRPPDPPAIVRVGFLMYIFWRMGNAQPTSDEGGLSPDLLARIQETKSDLASLQVKTIVASVPIIERMQSPIDIDRRPDESTVRFAQLLGAPLINGSEAFAGVSISDVPSDYLVGDVHWNQAGSDRFAKFMVDQITRLFASSLENSQSVAP